uniref:RING-type E3 ubiquitin transferase n=1 Tax=Leersia perrieri TaxID=77586 RepID=A0A0D9UW78_9ORYZ
MKIFQKVPQGYTSRQGKYTTTQGVPLFNHKALISMLSATSEAAMSLPIKRRSSPTEELEGEKERSKMKLRSFMKPGKEQQEVVVLGRPDSEISVRMDSNVLDCIICFEPLKPPIFQCEVGHVVCSVCLSKIGERCHMCCKTTRYRRCFALEQFIDAIKVQCSNAKYGCNEFIAYYQKEKHEQECIHVPCFCPENGCSFEGSTRSLLDHLVTMHEWSPTNIKYNKALRISMARDRRFTLFVGEDLSMFLLGNILTDIGNALTMVCIGPHDSELSYSSKISVVDRVACEKGRFVFQMDPLVESSSLSGGIKLGKFFLLVPPELVDGSTGELTINVRIDKVNP